jgi:predicted transcriptional regulator
MPKAASGTVPILTRVSHDLKARLKAIALEAERSESYVAAQAIASFVDLHERQTALIARRLAEAEAEAGAPTVTHEDVAAWVETRGGGRR